jgi:hypothetical protein
MPPPTPAPYPEARAWLATKPPPVALPASVSTCQHDRVTYVLAEVNIARLKEPLDSPLLADFVAALDPVNAAADLAPGFLWRLKTDDGNATSILAFEWDRAGSAGVIVNMSVWESVDALAAYVYSDTHRQVLQRRRTWFQKMTEAHLALWWIPRGHVPTVGEAEERVLRLREDGPTPYAFTLKEHFPPVWQASDGVIRGRAAVLRWTVRHRHGQATGVDDDCLAERDEPAQRQGDRNAVALGQHPVIWRGGQQPVGTSRNRHRVTHDGTVLGGEGDHAVGLPAVRVGDQRDRGGGDRQRPRGIRRRRRGRGRR